jgi:beta-galactosidase
MDAAVLIEYDQDQAHAANHLSMPSPVVVAETAHRDLWRRKLPVGVVEATDSFDGLKLLIVPSFTMMDEELVAKLEKFVRGGGALLITAWSGTRDRRNQITPLSAPGLLAGLVGATVEEFSVQEDGQNVIELADGTEAKCCKWYELLEPTTAKVVGKWTKAHLVGKAAMTLNQVGSGKVFYVGTYLSKDNVAAILDQVLAVAGISPVLPDMPEPVEATVRTAAGKRLLFLLNHSVDEQTVMHLPAGTELISGKSVLGKLTLPGKDVAVIKVRE